MIFKIFFQKNLKKDPRFSSQWARFIGEYVGFFHYEHDLLDKNVFESFERKIVRFDEKIKKNNCIFLRTITTSNYEAEIKHYKKFQYVMDKKYPNISYIICFMIPNQPNTQYYKHLDNRTFLFTLNDKSHINENLKNEYKPIFDFITNENLFINIPNSNDIEIYDDLSTRLWLVDGYPTVNFIEK